MMTIFNCRNQLLNKVLSNKDCDGSKIANTIFKDHMLSLNILRNCVKFIDSFGFCITLEDKDCYNLKTTEPVLVKYQQNEPCNISWGGGGGLHENRFTAIILVKGCF